MNSMRVDRMPTVMNHHWELEYVEQDNSHEKWRVSLVPDDEGEIFPETLYVNYDNWQGQVRAAAERIVSRKAFREASKQVRAGTRVVASVR